MPTFTDTADRRHDLSLNVATLRRVKAQTDFDLTDLTALQRLGTDASLLVDVLWAIVEPQNPRITPEQFAESFSGDVIEQAADALMAAIVDFFPRGRREILSLAMDKTRQIETQAMARARAQIEGTTLDDLVAAEPTQSGQAGQPGSGSGG